MGEEDGARQVGRHGVAMAIYIHKDHMNGEDFLKYSYSVRSTQSVVAFEIDAALSAWCYCHSADHYYCKYGVLRTPYSPQLRSCRWSSAHRSWNASWRINGCELRLGSDRATDVIGLVV